MRNWKEGKVRVMPRWGSENGGSVAPTASLALAATKCRVITGVQVKRMVEEAVAKDRLEWTLRLGEEAKAKIAAARAELQGAIQEIERLRLHTAGLESEAEFLREEKKRLEAENEKLRRAPEEARTSLVSPSREPLSALSQRTLIDSFVSRLDRVESLLATHLIQDHRQSPAPDLSVPCGGGSPDPSGHPNGKEQAGPRRKPSKSP